MVGGVHSHFPPLHTWVGQWFNIGLCLVYTLPALLGFTTPLPYTLRPLQAQGGPYRRLATTTHPFAARAFLNTRRGLVLRDVGGIRYATTTCLRITFWRTLPACPTPQADVLPATRCRSPSYMPGHLVRTHTAAHADSFLYLAAKHAMTTVAPGFSWRYLRHALPRIAARGAHAHLWRDHFFPRWNRHVRQSPDG